MLNLKVGFCCGNFLLPKVAKNAYRVFFVDVVVSVFEENVMDDICFHGNYQKAKEDSEGRENNKLRFAEFFTCRGFFLPSQEWAHKVSD